MIGGAGEDVYYVDNVGDQVVEALNEGTGDIVYSSISYALGANVERLYLTGTAAITATGNELNNTLYGQANTAANRLIGGAGNDVYSVGAGDTVVELDNGGFDWVYSNVSHILSANVEHLVLQGAAATHGTGNELNNTLYGHQSTAANVLSGGLGNDVYYVSTEDRVVEEAGEGTDTVYAYVDHTLSDHVENIFAYVNTGLSLTGNTLNNSVNGNVGNDTLSGGAGADVLNGGAGADTLDGGAGNDRLVGGVGGDTYLFGRGGGADVISENDTTSGNRDRTVFGAGVAVDQLWFRKVANNLEVSIIGGADSLTITDWYLGSAFRVEEFATSDGRYLQESQVQNLVQAMAAFSPPTSGQSTLPAPYQSALALVISANWM
jgi:Ca2+-binding RTX toxin-like protein